MPIKFPRILRPFPLESTTPVSPESAPSPEVITSVTVAARCVGDADQAAGKGAILLNVGTSLGRQLEVQVTPSLLLSPKQLQKTLIDELAVFPDDGPELSAQLQTLVHQNVPEVRQTQKSGWRGVPGSTDWAFVTPACVFGPSGCNYRFVRPVLQDLEALGACCGTLSGWQHSVGRVLAQSSVGLVLAGAALAAPLLRSASLAESFSINIHGRSTTGKSSIQSGAQSIQGRAGRPINPGSTERAFHEMGAEHNDLMLPIGDLTQISIKARRELQERLTYEQTAGLAKQHSRTVHKSLPPLTYATISMFSAEISSAEIASQAGRSRLAGEGVRCFDVPPSDKGFFDMRKADEGRSDLDLINDLNQSVQSQHGVVLAVWIEWLGNKKPEILKAEVDQIVGEFVRSLDQKPMAREHRIAEKFGLIYAALILAERAGAVDWRAKRSLRAVQLVFLRAITTENQTSPNSAVERFYALLQRDGAVLKTGKGLRSALDENPNWLALETARLGVTVLGVRLGKVAKALGKPLSDLAFETLRSEGKLSRETWVKDLPGGKKQRLSKLLR